MNNNNLFKQYFAPNIVLVGICLVIAAALAGTYSIAQPIIEQNTKDAANGTMRELITSADSFSANTGDLWKSEDGKVEISEVSVAENGSGMVVTVLTTSFGGKLTEMVGIDASGAITGVKVTEHADTPGVGTKAQTEEHLAQYVGITNLSEITAKKDSAVDYVSGASVSSNAVHYGVYGALKQFEMMGGVN